MTDFIFIVISFSLAYTVKYAKNLLIDNELIYFREYLSIFLLWSIFIVILFGARGLYSTDRTLTIPKEIIGVLASIFYVSILMSAVIFFTQYKFFSRRVLLLTFLLLSYFLITWRMIKRIVLRKMIKKGFHNFNVLIVGTNDIARATFLLEFRGNSGDNT